jgi:UDP-N-acetylmuramate dehydrogenase
VEPHSIKQIKFLRRRVSEIGLPFVVIGEGSNLLFHDEGVRGLVLKIAHKFSKFHINRSCIISEAGIWVPKLARAIGRAGLTGMEHTIGIPGTLGGLISMNGGSKRKNIGSNVKKILVVDRKGGIFWLKQNECQFSYRNSILKNSELIMIMAELECEIGNPRRIRSEMLNTMQERRMKFPLKKPNCGSVFISKPHLYETIGPPGKAIEDAGLKGLELIKRIRESVYKRTHHLLECEVRFVTPFGDNISVDKLL